MCPFVLEIFHVALSVSVLKYQMAYPLLVLWILCTVDVFFVVLFICACYLGKGSVVFLQTSFTVRRIKRMHGWKELCLFISRFSVSLALAIPCAFLCMMLVGVASEGTTPTQNKWM